MKTIVILDKSYKIQENGTIIGEYIGDNCGISEINLAVHEDIPYFKPVVSSGYVADSSNLLHRGKVVGISTCNIPNGFTGNLQYSGEIVNNLWTWGIGDIIFINQKNLSNIVPTEDDSFWSQQIGIAIRPNTIVLELKHSILL